MASKAPPIRPPSFSYSPGHKATLWQRCRTAGHCWSMQKSDLLTKFACHRSLSGPKTTKEGLETADCLDTLPRAPIPNTKQKNGLGKKSRFWLSRDGPGPQCIHRQSDQCSHPGHEQRAGKDGKTMENVNTGPGSHDVCIMQACRTDRSATPIQIKTRQTLVSNRLCQLLVIT